MSDDHLVVEVPAEMAGERLDRIVSMLVGSSRAGAAELVTAGHVTLNGRAPATRSVRVAEGDVVVIDDVPRSELAVLRPDPSVEVPVVHVDDHVVVVDKPAGLVVHPGAGDVGSSLVAGALAMFPEMAEVGPDPMRPGVVHRLDRDTSGLMVLARSQLAYEGLVAALSERQVDRTYVALAWGHFDDAAGIIDAPVGRSQRHRTRMAVTERGREARTRYVVQRSFDRPVEASLLECALETGRTHQIRVHLRALGHPVVGDPWYGGARQSFEVPRLFLHAGSLAFEHPAGLPRIELVSDLPPDLAGVLSALS